MRTCSARVLSTLFLLTGSLAAFAQTAAPDPEWISLSLTPRMSLPVSDTDLFGMGGGAVFSQRFHLSGSPVQFGPDISYAMQAIRAGGESFEAFSLGASVEWNLKIAPWLVARLYGEGGYLYAHALGSGGGTFYVGAGFDAGYRVTPSFEAGLVCGFRRDGELFTEADVGLQGRLLIPGGS